MSPVATIFLEPLDVLFLRGNKLFGDPGSFGESLVPPWPSVAAGAVRSRMLVDAKVDLAAFGRGEIAHPELGTPMAPGSFAVTAFQLARCRGDNSVEPLFQPPADLVVIEDKAEQISVHSLTPAAFHVNGGLCTSYPLPLLPVLARSERGKPSIGHWLTEAGWCAYLAGTTPSHDQLVKSTDLWKIDPRVGVGLDAVTRRAADGRLFSMLAVAMVKQGHRIDAKKQTGESLLADYDVGFLVAVIGATLPKGGTVRLGGDGRAAAVHPADYSLPEPDYAAIAAARRCRLVLTTPGLFADGWLPTGFSPPPPGDGPGVRDIRFDLHGVRGRIVSAAMPRGEVVSGWDLASWQPKDAQRAASVGSVWWLDNLEASPEALRNLAERGLWNESCEDASRRAEGFNRVCIAAWTAR